MDPVTVSVLAQTIASLLGGAGGEAGRRALASLMSTVRIRLGGRSASAEAMESLDCDPAADQQAAAQALVADAAGDGEFASWLREWLAEARPLVQSQSVVNRIGGNASVRGPVVQAGTVGSISFGAPAPDTSG